MNYKSFVETASTVDGKQDQLYHTKGQFPTFQNYYYDYDF